MATSELVILSSSPPKRHTIADSDDERIVTPPRFHAARTIISSSPDLPSLADILARPPDIPTGLKSGSKAVELPQGATLGFLSAASLVKDHGKGLDAPTVDADDRIPVVQDQPPLDPTTAAGKLKRVTKRADIAIKAKAKDDSAPKKPRKRTTKPATDNSAITVSGGEREPAAAAARPAQTLAEDVVAREAHTEAAAAKPKPRKSRAKKDKNMTDVQVDKEGTTSEPQPAKKPARKKAAETGEKKRRNATDTVSAHFSRTTSPEKEPVAAAAPEPAPFPEGPLALEPAMARRRSWTPISPSKDLEAGSVSPESGLLGRVEGSTVTQAARTSAATHDSTFASLLNNFNYVHEAPEAVRARSPRAESGEALTKRRKIELVAHPAAPAVSESSEPPMKKGKAVKKKPRTITDLATSAYRVVEPADTTTSAKISKFFAPQAPENEKAPDEVAKASKAAPSKRAPRPKNPAKKDGVKKATKAAGKSKKAVKLIAEKLMSPETAKRRMERQDLLFGTSSQLAREDSPGFVRALQQAMRESEATGALDYGELETLHLRPRPRGLGFSLVGRGKGLWAAAARDEGDAVTDGRPLPPSSPPPAEVQTESSPVDAGPVNQEALDQQETLRQDFADFAVSSPPPQVTAEAKEQDVLFPVRESQHFLSRITQRPEGLADFDWLPPSGQLEGSDVPPPSTQLPRNLSSDYMDIDDLEDMERLSAKKVVPSFVSSSPKASSVSPVRRTALQSLPACLNIPPLSKATSDIGAARFKSTLTAKSASKSDRTASAPPISPVKRPRGRPRKVTADAESFSEPEDPSPVSTAPPVKRRPGRPRKETTGSERPASPEKSIPRKRTVSPKPSTAPLFKRGPGRPRKDGTDSERPTSPKKSIPRKRTVSPKPSPALTTPRKSKAKGKKSIGDNTPGWTNIDEIEDSEVEVTPSPPRRRNIPATSPPLRLASTEASNAVTLAAALSTNVTATAGVPAEQLEEFRLSLFPRISSIVTSAPRTTDPSHPSWHEKILLYDPIVIEDLAEFLSKQGLRIEMPVKVPKAKPKKKARSKKRKDAELESEADEDDVELEARTELQEVPAWVVQKWCEEHSVCCMNKESLRSGRKARG